MRNSAGEFGLLLEGFGEVLRQGPDQGTRAVFVDDMRLFFEENQFPPDWQQMIKDASAMGWALTSFGKTGFGGIYAENRKAYAATRGPRAGEGSH